MQHGKSYFFVGIGGSGMMPLAMILKGRRAIVAGSDRSLDQGRVPAKFAELERRGIALFPQDGSGVTAPEQIVVASAAIEPSVADMVAAERIGARRMTRPELLAELFNASALPIGVAGTSGKSTVTGMIGWILHAARRRPTVMNGAVMKNFATPDAPFASALVGQGDAFVSEVDESDGSIAHYAPRIAVLNNVSLDHKSMEELRDLFGGFIAKARTAVVNVGDAEAAALAMALPRDRLLTVAVGEESAADLVALDLEPSPAGIDYTLIEGGRYSRLSLQVPGAHNVANALAAIGAAQAAGLPALEAARALAGFTGLRRRLDRIGEAGGIAVYDDFGHNPDKITATLETLHAFPGRLLILFQPHGYGPLKTMRAELVAAFAQKLAAEDVLVLPDPAYFGGTVTREVTSADIAADVAATGRDARHVPDRAAAAAMLVSESRPGDRIVVMGARDDTLTQLATEMLEAIARRGE